MRKAVVYYLVFLLNVILISGCDKDDDSSSEQFDTSAFVENVINDKGTSVESQIKDYITRGKVAPTKTDRLGYRDAFERLLNSLKQDPRITDVQGDYGAIYVDPPMSEIRLTVKDANRRKEVHIDISTNLEGVVNVMYVRPVLNTELE